MGGKRERGKCMPRIAPTMHKQRTGGWSIQSSVVTRTLSLLSHVYEVGQNTEFDVYLDTLVRLRLFWGVPPTTVATYCPSRMVEHPKSKSTQPRYSTTRVTLYYNYKIVKLHLDEYLFRSCS